MVATVRMAADHRSFNHTRIQLRATENVGQQNTGRENDGTDKNFFQSCIFYPLEIYSSFFIHSFIHSFIHLRTQHCN